MKRNLYVCICFCWPRWLPASPALQTIRMWTILLSKELKRRCFGRPVHHVARWHLLCLWHPCDEGIEVYTSDDLKTWKYKGMALQKKDVWADRWFWAPEVYEVNGKFYMYYSADEHICVATADSPAGPLPKVRRNR